MEQSTRTVTSLTCALFCALFCALGSVATISAAETLLDPTEEYRNLATLTSPLSTRELTEIALVFSGVPTSDRDRYHGAVDTLQTGAREYIRSDSGIDSVRADPYATAEALLQYLHHTVLRRYSEPQTRIDVLLDDGTFNCVSSAVLYLIVARSLDLDVFGTVTPDHAFCSIRIDAKTVDIETTTEHGFDPGRRTEFHDSFGNLTGYSYVPPGNYALREEVDERELLSFILHNRISMYDSRNRFEDALQTSVDRHAFLSTEETFADVIREIGNYLALLNTRQHYAEALRFVVDVNDRFGDIDALDVVSYSVLHNRVISLLETYAFDDAWSLILEHSARGFVSPEQSVNLRQMVIQHDLARTLPTLDVDEAFAYLERRMRESALPTETFADYHILVFTRLAERVAVENDYLEASRVVDEAIEVVGRDPRLVRAREVYRYNYAAEAHNLFADEFNAGRLSAAKALVQDALELVPESSLLKNDLSMVERAIERADRD